MTSNKTGVKDNKQISLNSSSGIKKNKKMLKSFKEKIIEIFEFPNIS